MELRDRIVALTKSLWLLILLGWGVNLSGFTTAYVEECPGFQVIINKVGLVSPVTGIGALLGSMVGGKYFVVANIAGERWKNSISELKRDLDDKVVGNVFAGYDTLREIFDKLKTLDQDVKESVRTILDQFVSYSSVSKMLDDRNKLWFAIMTKMQITGLDRLNELVLTGGESVRCAMLKVVNSVSSVDSLEDLLYNDHRIDEARWKELFEKTSKNLRMEILLSLEKLSNDIVAGDYGDTLRILSEFSECSRSLRNDADCVNWEDKLSYREVSYGYRSDVSESSSTDPGNVIAS